MEATIMLKLWPIAAAIAFSIILVLYFKFQSDLKRTVTPYHPPAGLSPCERADTCPHKHQSLEFIPDREAFPSSKERWCFTFYDKHDRGYSIMCEDSDSYCRGILRSGYTGNSYDEPTDFSDCEKICRSSSGYWALCE